MLAPSTTSPRSPAALAALAVALGGAATILGAWFFQHVLGLRPCPLCLEQRYPYYFAIPLAGDGRCSAHAVGSRARAPARRARGASRV